MHKITSSNTLKNLSSSLVLMVLSVCLLIITPQNPLHPYYWGDSAIYEYVAKMMLKGQTLYQDVFDHKSPLVYWLHMLGYSVYPMYGNWFLKVILMFLTLLMAFHITKQQLSSPLALGLIALIFFTTPIFCTLDNSEALGLLPVFYIMSFTSKYMNNQKINRLDYFITGLMCATLSLLKLIYLAVPFALLLYVLVDALTRKSAQTIKNLLIYCGLGFLLPIILTILWFYRQNALSDLFETTIVFNLQYTKHYQTNGNSSFLEILTFFITIPSSILALISMLICFIKRSIFNTNEQKIIILLSAAFIFNLLIITLPLNAHANYIFILYPIILGLITFALKSIPQKPIKYTIVLCGILFYGYKFYTAAYKQNLTYEYLSDTYKQIAEEINRSVAKEDSFAVISRRIPNELLYLYMDHPAAIKYPVTFSVIKVAPNKIKQETTTKKLKWIVTDNIHAYKDFIDISRYGLLYKNNYVKLYKNKMP